MLVEWFVGFVVGLVGGLLELLPEGDPLDLDLAPAFDAIGAVNALIPVDAAFAAVAAIGVVFGVIFLFGLIRQVWRFVPIIGGG